MLLKLRALHSALNTQQWEEARKILAQLDWHLVELIQQRDAHKQTEPKKVGGNFKP